MASWRVFTQTLLEDFFVKNIGKFKAYDILAVWLKFYWLTFEKCFEAPAALGSCYVTSSRHGLKIISRRAFNIFSWNPHVSKISLNSCSRHQKFAYTLTVETLSSGIFVWRTYLSGEIFVTKRKIRHFYPMKIFAQ